MPRVRDLWHDRDRTKTPRHPDNGGNPNAKRWLAIWAAPGGKEATRAFSRKPDAIAHATAMQADALRGTYIDPKAAKVSTGEWCDRWLDGYQTRRPSTVRQAQVHIKQIKAEFGGLPLVALRPSHVRAWTSRLTADGAEASYIYALHGRLAQIMSDAVHDGLLAKSPCSRRTSPRQGSQRPYVATTEEVWALHDAMPPRLRAAILLAAFAGLRLAEACGLRVCDVDFMRAIISPAVQYPAQPLKTDISRNAVPIAKAMSLALSAHLAQWPAQTILTGRDGGQLTPSALERAFRGARSRVRDLPDGFRYHDLRHYFASLLIADGADVKTVQARIRHASAKTTLDTYGHLWPDRDESTRATVEAVFNAREAEPARNWGDAR